MRKRQTRKKYSRRRKQKGGINTPDSSFGSHDISNVSNISLHIDDDIDVDNSRNTTTNTNDWSVNQPEIDHFGMIEPIEHDELDGPLVLNDDLDLDLDLDLNNSQETTKEDISFGGKKHKKRKKKSIKKRKKSNRRR
jgi:hypothetical protein